MSNCGFLFTSKTSKWNHFLSHKYGVEYVGKWSQWHKSLLHLFRPTVLDLTLSLRTSVTLPENQMAFLLGQIIRKLDLDLVQQEDPEPTGYWYSHIVCGNHSQQCSIVLSKCPSKYIESLGNAVWLWNLFAKLLRRWKLLHCIATCSHNTNQCWTIHQNLFLSLIVRPWANCFQHPWNKEKGCSSLKDGNGTVSQTPKHHAMPRIFLPRTAAATNFATINTSV